MSKKTSLLVSAAVMGILGAVSASQGLAADPAAEGKCVGANGCHGKGACMTAANGCAGQNGCGGKSFLKMTKAKCDKLTKKDKKIHWEAEKKDAT